MNKDENKACKNQFYKTISVSKEEKIYKIINIKNLKNYTKEAKYKSFINLPEE